ncbi:MAG: acyl-CoA dehydrogenase [Jatrophihabitans sp.]|nr:MAG: acyl-CoA dehydrogenase [Jatrophihabitans sp.]
MDLDLTPEQRLLAETLDDLLDKRYPPNERLALLRSDDGWSRAMWEQYAALGLLGLPFAEEHGGAGMGAAELLVVAESFGKALVLEPYLPTVVLGGSLVAAAGTQAQQAQVLPRVADGSLLLAFAYAEPSSRWALAASGTRYANGRISGAKVTVIGGDRAHRLVVTAADPSGTTGLYLVDAQGVRRDGYAMQDGLRGADVVFDDAPAEPLGSGGDALPVVRRVLDLATAYLCAEAVGAMERMLAMTVEYLKTRVQFGHPIAVFQALQHRAADMYVSVEQSRSMALLARLALAPEQDDDARHLAIRAAKVQIDLASRHVSQEAIQLHGGIGMTMEYPVGHYAKRVAVIAKTFADTDLLVTELGAAGGLT